MTILRNLIKRSSALALAAVLLPSLAVPALARDTYVQDGAGMLSATTVSSLNQSIGDFSRQTGKEVVVVTVPSLDGSTAPEAAEKVFAQQQVNGVLVFLAKAEKKDGIIGDRASQAFFPSGSFDSIRQAMRGYFRDGDYDTGITTGVGLILNQYRSHERSMSGAAHSQSYAPGSSQQSMGGGGMSLFWLILILIAGFLIIRAVFRAIAGAGRVAPPGYGGPGMGGPGMGGMPGGGYGYGGGGGGGGSFFSGLLGGLGGAFLGNELFGRQNFGGGNMGDGNVGNMGGNQGGGDSGGWQSDPGQADPGNSSFGDFGSSGGGFGDSGGGFGDGGGGGGDSGGGW